MNDNEVRKGGRVRKGDSPAEGALFLAAFVANCFLGAFPPVDFLAVCLVLAILFTLSAVGE